MTPTCCFWTKLLFAPSFHFDHEKSIDYCRLSRPKWEDLRSNYFPQLFIANVFKLQWAGKKKKKKKGWLPWWNELILQFICLRTLSPHWRPVYIMLPWPCETSSTRTRSALTAVVLITTSSRRVCLLFYLPFSWRYLLWCWKQNELPRMKSCSGNLFLSSAFNQPVKTGVTGF